MLLLKRGPLGNFKELARWSHGRSVSLLEKTHQKNAPDILKQIIRLWNEHKAKILLLYNKTFLLKLKLACPGC